VLEIVIDGLDLPAVEEATRRGILAATETGDALQISAGNYGGTLGQYQIKLHEVLNGHAKTFEVPETSKV
jgi:formylmethanofuran--tetrahydromethanopterin N-formyltransferase